MKSIGDENDSNEGYTYRKRFLGEKEVPSRAYYGVQTLRAVENFPITGYRIHPSLITAMAIVKSGGTCKYRYWLLGERHWT